MCILLNILLECHGYNFRFRKRLTNFFFSWDLEKRVQKRKRFKAMDFDGYKVHCSCKTVLTVFKSIMELFRKDVSFSISH